MTIPVGFAQASVEIKPFSKRKVRTNKFCLEEYERYLIRQEYPKSLVDEEFNKPLKSLFFCDRAQSYGS